MAEIDLLTDFRALVGALEQNRIEYAVAGALALAVHGFPRATTDIDLLVRKEDLSRVLQAVGPLGYRFPAEPLTFHTGLEVQRVTKIVGTEHLTLDLLLVNERIEHIWAERMRVASEDGSLQVISRGGLVEMKAAASRPQDLVDLERLRGDPDE